MLSLYLRFNLLVFQFIFIINCNFILTGNKWIFVLQIITFLDNTLSRNQCRTSWHYLSGDSTCIIFATSEIGDVPWYDSYKACETNSAELLTLSNSIKFQLVEKQFNQLESDNYEQSPIYFDHMQRGAWIGKASKIERQ
jgi:hypothetical protein